MFREPICIFIHFYRICLSFQSYFTSLVIFIHREEFDEEKEPDGMLLSGWTQPLSTEEKEEDQSINGNGAGTSEISVSAVEDGEVDEIGIVPTGKKRKVPESSKVAASGDKTTYIKTLQVIDDEDDLVMLDDGNSSSNKKKRLQ